MKALFIGSLVGLLSLLVFLPSCNTKKLDDTTEYTASYIVYQTNGYSDVAQVKSTYWPVHTSTWFQWELGSFVMTNHGANFSETDKKGNYFLKEIKAYSLRGTISELSALEQELIKAGCDAEKPLYLDIYQPSTNLEKKMLNRLADIVSKDKNFACHGFIKKDSLVKLFNSGSYDKVVSELGNCNWKAKDWEKAFNTALEEELILKGLTLQDYHSCNNDAAKQTQLIKTFIETGKVTSDTIKCDGVKWFFDPK